MLMLEQLLTQMHWQVDATFLEVTLQRIQDVVTEQLSLMPGETERQRKLREVQCCLAARFGAGRLRWAVLSRPAAPLPEWRVGWLEEP